MDEQGDQDGHAHTAVCKTGNQQRPTVPPRELCSAFCGRLEGWGGGLGGGWMHVYVWLCCPSEISTALLIDYTPIQYEKFKNKK